MTTVLVKLVGLYIVQGICLILMVPLSIASLVLKALESIKNKLMQGMVKLTFSNIPVILDSITKENEAIIKNTTSAKDLTTYLVEKLDVNKNMTSDIQNKMEENNEPLIIKTELESENK